VTRVDRELAELIVTALQQERERTGRLAAGSIAQACQTLGSADGRPLPRGTLLRWLRSGLPCAQRASTRFALDEFARGVIAEANGSRTLAYEWLAREHGEDSLPSLRTFQRAFNRDLTRAERDTLLEGVRGQRKHRAWLAMEVEHRNHIWQADHKQLNVSVLAPGKSDTPKQPWLTYFLDGYSRAIMGWAISLQPNQSVVLAAFRQAILENLKRGPFCGRPRVLYIDHGLEFLADAIIECCSVIGTRGVVLPPYSPQQKGRIERAHRTIITRFLQALPAFTGGATNTRGRPVVSPGKPLPLQVLLGQFTEWVQHYNHERPHRALGSRPPVVAWEEDPTPIVAVEERRLDRYMLRGETRTVRRGKIEFTGHFYIAGELHHHNGSQIEVRWDTEDMRTIEVYLDEQHLCTAVNEDEANSEEREAYIHQARAEEALIRRDLRTARRRSRRRYKAMVDDSAIVETTMVPADARARQTAAARRKASELIEHLDLREKAP
jgi:transposase InsO family protein